jgi:hypothetical protein
VQFVDKPFRINKAKINGMKKNVVLGLLVLLFTGCTDGDELVVCVQIDPLEKVLKEQMYSY